MNTTLLIRVQALIVIVGFLLCAPAVAPYQGQSASPISSPTPVPSPTVLPSPNSSFLPSPSDTSNRSKPPATESEKESFSQLTLFLFGSGLGLFIALLGWSDQIRGIDRDTRELENQFLQKTGIDKRAFLSLVKPEVSDDHSEALAQLEALTQIVQAGQLNTGESKELLRTFATSWKTELDRLETLSSWKYNLSILLTVVLFVGGTVSLYTSPAQRVDLVLVSPKTESLILLLPIILIMVLMVVIVLGVRGEKKLRSLLNSMSDKL